VINAIFFGFLFVFIKLIHLFMYYLRTAHTTAGSRWIAAARQTQTPGGRTEEREGERERRG